MRIATWNVNSVRARLPRLVPWLEEHRPDVVCLQEIKSIDENFPGSRIEELGYNVALHGQKGFNGVAILSKHPLADLRKGLPGDPSDTQARYLEATISCGDGAIRVASIYLPNGNPVESEKYGYKLGWMDRLRQHAKDLLELEEAFVLAGDYNVIPSDLDVHNPQAWAEDALFRSQTRAKFHAFTNLGLTDALRACHQDANQYTFWDYQAGAWQKNNGIRIDHLMLSPQAADRLRACEIDRFTRAWESPSDHVPVWIELAA